MLRLTLIGILWFSGAAQAQLDLFPNAFVDDSSRCPAWSEEIGPAQRAVIEQYAADHSHRLSHLLWHATRNGWSSFTPQTRASIQSLSPEWGRNAPLCPAPARHEARYNPAGEEFLLMHHQMIDGLRSQLIARGQPCIRGWTAIPEAGDPRWPMPPGAADDSSKSEAMGRLIQNWARAFKDPKFLSTHSLSQVGYILESSLHNNMHMRWASLPRPGDDYSPLEVVNINLSAPSPYDSPQYNWLGNPFSSAVNPVFWKLHGFVDDVISEWLHVNGYISIAADCRGRKACYQWRSSWVGAGHGAHRHEPIGGGAPGRGLPGELDRSLREAAPAAGFRNRKFDQFLSEPRGGGAPPGRGPGAGPDPVAELMNPEVFVERFGPCSR